MAEFTKPSLCAVYGIINESEGNLFGSGTFINFQSNAYLLTAGHVLKTTESYKGLAHTCSSGFQPSYFKYPKTILTNEQDLGLVRIDSDLISKTNIIPLESSHLAQSSKSVNDDLFFIHGYPGKRSKFLRIFNGVVSESLPYVAILGNSILPWFDPSLHIALDYPTTPQSAGMTLPDPRGLSGSAVWHVKHHSKWSPKEATIIGIVHTWDDKGKCLIATRIEVVRDFVLKCLRQECAYYNWLSRGKPIRDDLTDWFYSCDKIKSL